MTKYQIFSPDGLKTCIIEASSIVHTPKFSILYGKWIQETNTIEPICTLFKGFQAVPLDNLTEEDFTIKLKELLLKYDFEEGSDPDVEFAGWSIWEFYCKENKVDSGNYKQEIDCLFSEYNSNDSRKYYYVASDDALKQGDLVCKVGDTIPIGHFVEYNGNVAIIKRILGFPAPDYELMPISYPIQKLDIIYQN